MDVYLQKEFNPNMKSFAFNTQHNN